MLFFVIFVLFRDRVPILYIRLGLSNTARGTQHHHSMQPAQKGGARQAQHAGDAAREEGWRLSYSVTPEEMRSVAMPEPQHRWGVCSAAAVAASVCFLCLYFAIS